MKPKRGFHLTPSSEPSTEMVPANSPAQMKVTQASSPVVGTSVHRSTDGRGPTLEAAETGGSEMKTLDPIQSQTL